MIEDKGSAAPVDQHGRRAFSHLPHLIASPWQTAWSEVLAALSAVLERPGPAWIPTVALLASTLAAWWVYVPLHELLHAWGCLAAGGTVEELQIAPLYGGALFERIVPFVTSGGEYAGRLTRFDTGGSDLVYLFTDLAPYLLTVFAAYPLLRAARRRPSALAAGAGLVLIAAPLIGLTGDYYEMGSILTSALGNGHTAGSPWAALRHDDLIAVIREFSSRFPEPRLGWGLAVAAASAAGIFLAGLTLGAGALLASCLPGAYRDGATPRPPIRCTLPPPRRADPRHRRLFHPRRGWFRRFERWVNLMLSRHLFPRLPGMAAFYGLQLRFGLTVSEADVPIAGLPQAFDGAGILFMTDLHAGPFLSPAALRGVFDRLQRLQPDLLLLGGDLTTTRVAELEEQRALFRELQAPLGVFAVLGNHDHYTGDPAAVRALLEDCGITVLHNRSVVLQRDGRRIILSGIDDLHSGQPDLERALQGAPDDVTTILLSHNPDIFFEAARRGVALVLSGHTHGGQIRIPGLPVLVRMSRYRLDHGRFETDGAQLVVSRGLGVTGMPLRIACSPETVFVRLRAAAPPGSRPDG
jgi:hypothetical protein